MFKNKLFYLIIQFSLINICCMEHDWQELQEEYRDRQEYIELEDFDDKHKPEDDIQDELDLIYLNSNFDLTYTPEYNYDINKLLSDLRIKNKNKNSIFKNNKLVKDKEKKVQNTDSENSNLFDSLPPDNAIVILIATFLLPKDSILKSDSIEIQDIYRDVASFLGTCKRFYNIKIVINEFIVKALYEKFPEIQINLKDQKLIYKSDFKDAFEEVQKINPKVNIVHMCMIKKEDKNTKLKYDLNNSKIILASLIIKNRYNPDLIKNLNAPDTIGRTPIQWAAAYNQYKIIRAFIKLGVIVNSKDITKISPLHEAARKNSYESLRELLEDNKIDIDAKNNLEETALYIACKYRFNNIVNLLIKKGADVTIYNCESQTPLHVCASECNIDVIKVIIDAWADPNAQDILGDTPLHNAVYKKNLNTARILIKNGATNTVRNNKFQRPIDIARILGDDDMVNLIKDYDNKCNIV